MPEVWHLEPSEVAVIDANAAAMGCGHGSVDDSCCSRTASMCIQGNKGHVWIYGPGNNGGDGFRLAMMLDDCSVIVSRSKNRSF